MLKLLSKLIQKWHQQHYVQSIALYKAEKKFNLFAYVNTPTYILIRN